MYVNDYAHLRLFNEEQRRVEADLELRRIAGERSATEPRSRDRIRVWQRIGRAIARLILPDGAPVKAAD